MHASPQHSMMHNPPPPPPLGSPFGHYSSPPGSIEEIGGAGSAAGSARGSVGNRGPPPQPIIAFAHPRNSNIMNNSSSSVSSSSSHFSQVPPTIIQQHQERQIITAPTHNSPNVNSIHQNPPPPIRRESNPVFLQPFRQERRGSTSSVTSTCSAIGAVHASGGVGGNFFNHPRKSTTSSKSSNSLGAAGSSTVSAKDMIIITGTGSDSSSHSVAHHDHSTFSLVNHISRSGSTASMAGLGVGGGGSVVDHLSLDRKSRLEAAADLFHIPSVFRKSSTSRSRRNSLDRSSAYLKPISTVDIRVSSSSTSDTGYLEDIPNVYSALLSEVARAFKAKIILDSHVKDGLEYVDCFTGRTAVVSIFDYRNLA